MKKFSANKYFLLFLCFSGFVAAEENRYTLYGYSQADFKTSINESTPASFSLRRINIIGDIAVDERVRTLLDIEFEGDADHSPQKNIGIIKLSRGWGEYTLFPELKIRAGKMLTPFGLYNIVHDFSATYFPIDPPFLYFLQQPFPTRPAQRFFGKYFTGIEVLGTYDINTSGSQLEYSFGIGNGRGVQDDGNDSNNDKCVLARMVFRPSSMEGVQLGASWYGDRNAAGIGMNNDYESSAEVDVQYENSTIQLQSEVMSASFADTLGRAQRALIAYVQLAYTMFDRITPFVNNTLVNYNVENSGVFFKRIHVGLNIAVTGHLLLKTEIQFHSTEETKGTIGNHQVIQGSVAIAF